MCFMKLTDDVIITIHCVCWRWQKLAELAERLDVRERKLVELSQENMDLIETNTDFRKQVSH